MAEDCGIPIRTSTYGSSWSGQSSECANPADALATWSQKWLLLRQRCADTLDFDTTLSPDYDTTRARLKVLLDDDKIRPALFESICDIEDQLKIIQTLHGIFAAAHGVNSPDGGMLWSLMQHLMISIKRKAGGNVQMSVLSTLITDFVNLLAKITNNYDSAFIYAELPGCKERLHQDSPGAMFSVANLVFGMVTFLMKNNFNSGKKPTDDNDKKRTLESWRILHGREIGKALTTAESLHTKVDGLAKVAHVTSAVSRASPMTSRTSTFAITQDLTYCNINRYQKDFFGRAEVLERVRNELDHSRSEGPFRCVALCGKGGVGKTSIAREYCRQRKHDGVGLIFWVNAATELDLWQSLSKIAVDLGLEKAEPGKTHQNAAILCAALERESFGTPWIMVLDNVENLSVVRACAVSSSYGALLITSRREIGTSDIVGIKIQPFNGQEGADFLYLRTQRKKPTGSEQLAARQVSDHFGGLPVALNLAASFIENYGTSFAKFLRDSRNNSRSSLARLDEERERLGPFYDRSLTGDTGIFRQTFDELKNTPAQRDLFAIMCLVEPENVPRQLFLGLDQQGKPDSALEFCVDEIEFENAIRALVQKGLVDRDYETEQTSVHRFIHMAFRYELSANELRVAFDNAAGLLIDVFPKLIKGLSLRIEWPACQMFARHIVQLARCFEERLVDVQKLEYREKLIDCFASCAWYLHESEYLNECLRFLKACNKLCEKGSLMEANLLNTEATVLDKQNRHQEAEVKFRQSLNIRLDRLGVSDPQNEEIANSYNNLGKAVLGQRRYQEALELFQKAACIDETKSQHERDSIIYIRYYNISNAYYLLNRFDQARGYAMKGLEIATKRFGEASFYVGRGREKLGLIALAQNDLCAATKEFEMALNLHRNVDPYAVQTGILLFRLAGVEMQQQPGESTIELLQEALKIAEANEATTNSKGEIARTQRRLAAVFNALGRVAEADAALREAKKLRKEIQGLAFRDAEDSEEAYQMLVSAHYR